MAKYAANFVGLMRCEGTNVSLGTNGAAAILTGTNCAFVGANTLLASSTASECVMVGASAEQKHTSPSNIVLVGRAAICTCTGNCVAIGQGAIVSTPNSIVFGSPTGEVALRETGYGHQYKWSLATYNATATLSGTDVANGWVAFESANAATVGCYLPTFAQLSAALPNIQDGTMRELILSNFSAQAATCQLRITSPNATLAPGDPNEVHVTYLSPSYDFLSKNTMGTLHCMYIATGATDGVWDGPCFVFYL